MENFKSGETYLIQPGEHFTLLLPDGTALYVEQTSDDFSLAHNDGYVAYTTATSNPAKEQDAELPRTTGRK